MMIKKSNRITAILLAFLVLGTSTGYSIDLHFCKGHLKSISLIGTAKSCHEASKQCPMHAGLTTDTSSEAKDCCTNEKITFEELDTDFTGPQLVELVDLQPIVFCLSESLFHQDLTVAYYPGGFKHYRPPPLYEDIPVLFQSFLI